MSATPSVTAIIAAFNEEDIIGAVLADLVEQGIRVHLLDHGSTDGTVAEAERHQVTGRIRIERLEPSSFSLSQIVRRKEALAAEAETDWIINADADEFRESPWLDVSFVDGLARVDALGYNAVDFAVLNFQPVDDTFGKGQDPRVAFRYYEPAAPFDRLQVRCWRKQAGPVDLVSTGGHEARFPGQRVFPLRFLLRHYPIRGQAHGRRKVFAERLPRFAAEERGRGWHVQYDGLTEDASFLREPSSLIPYDPWRARLDLALRHRGVEALERDLARSLEETAAAREALVAREAELAGTRASLAASQAELRGVHATLQAVLTSRIWRWTSPLRALLGALAGLRR